MRKHDETQLDRGYFGKVNYKKLFSMVLVIVLAFQAVPVYAFEEIENTALLDSDLIEELGTVENPFPLDIDIAEDDTEEAAAEDQNSADLSDPVERVELQATGDQGSEGDFTFTVLNGTYASITGYTGSEAEVVIPEEIGGYIVQTIGGSAFKGKTGITSVVIPDTVETI